MSLSPLELKDLKVKLGGKDILHGISFKLEVGEVFGLIGLNGVGKTTLIRSSLGLLPHQGEARFFGEKGEVSASRKKLVYFPEKFMPSPQIKGSEYLSLLFASYGLKLDLAKAKDLLQKLDFPIDALEAKVAIYSKGMGQKLGLAGAFLLDVPLLILDEPMSGLDPFARVRVKESVKAAQKEGKSVFFSSHILSDIEELCSRIGVIDAGKLIFLGTPQAFLENNQAENLEKALFNAVNKSRAN